MAVGRQCKLEAYHAKLRDLLAPSKSKPFNRKFLQMFLAPDGEYFLQQGRTRFTAMATPIHRRQLFPKFQVSRSRM